jgi:DNA-binding protein YbaB
VDAHIGVDANAAREWIQNWSTSLSGQVARAQAMSGQVAALSVSASSDDDAIEVTVGGSGVVTDLRLRELARKRPADELAAGIMAVMRQAHTRLTAAVAEITAQTVGADSSIARAVVAGFEARFPAAEGGAELDASDSDWRRRGR